MGDTKKKLWRELVDRDTGELRRTSRMGRRIKVTLRRYKKLAKARGLKRWDRG